MFRATAVLVLLVAHGAGCGDDSADPPPVDVPDASDDADLSDPLGDPDRDGLCNDTELSADLDPLDPDTDGDGFPDLDEVLVGYDPTMPADPPRSQVLGLDGSPGDTNATLVEVRVRGSGQDFTGSFDAQDTDLGSASDFFVGARAVGAEPAENAARVEEVAERYRGVVGETLLRFEIDVHVPIGAEIECTRGYPFRYVVKRSDGVIVSSRRYYLVVGDRGPLFEAETWCVPDLGGCY